MKRSLGLVLILALLGLVQPVAAADIKVMTQNQYLGADLTPLLTAPTRAAFNEAAVAALQQVAANRPADRVKVLAAEILWEMPALVGLQEVFLFECTDLAPPVRGQGCDDPTIRGAFVDHLQGTLKALHRMYDVAAIVTNINLTPGIPVYMDEVIPILVRVVDRDVILARFDVDSTPVDFTVYQPFGICTKPSDQGCNYRVLLNVDTPVGTLSVERGFVAVDAAVHGKAYRFVTTHLEEKHPGTQAGPIQALQAEELIQVLHSTTPKHRSLIVVGDTNSSPIDPEIPTFLGIPGFPAPLPTPYMQFVAAGYSDAWMLGEGNVSGFTCCQQADLSNRKSELYERVDMLFSRVAPADVDDAQLVGVTQLAKTPPFRGLWPSDHAAVAAELEFRLHVLVHGYPGWPH